MVKTKKTLIVVKSIDGGTGTFLLNFLSIQKEVGCNSKTLILEKPTYRFFKTKQNIEFLRDSSYYPLKYSITISNFINFISEVFWVKRHIAEYRPQVVLGVDLRCNLLILICKILFYQKVKIITTNHINLDETIYAKSTNILGAVLRILIGLFYRKADATVAVSKELSESLKENYKLRKNVCTIYNGIDIKKLSCRTIGKSKNRAVFVTVARLGEQKDFKTLILAFKLVHKKLKKPQLWLVGDGPEKEEIKKLIKLLGLENSVFLKGWFQNVQTILKKSDVFVFSSKREGFGYVLIEAMLEGLPIISTNTRYGPSEILDNGRYGILVPVGNVQRLAQSMLRVLDGKIYSCFSKKSIERAKYFSIKRMTVGYKKLFDKIMH